MNEVEEMNLEQSPSDSTGSLESDLEGDLPSVTSQPSVISQPSEFEQADLAAIGLLTRAAAQSRQGQSLELLALLRLLEALHQEIRDSLFQKSLPDNRQALYALLRDIEAEGGWPYIHRMKLQEFLAGLCLSEEESPELE